MLFAPLPTRSAVIVLLGPTIRFNRVSLEQLRAGILQRCVPGRLNASYVALIDFTMHHPFRHCLSRAVHEAYAIFHGSSEENRHRRNATRP
jgi:hypothetical protein